MHSLQKQFHDFVQAEELLHEDENILLAVSGGLDSMIMAELFLNAEWDFSVAHCNFNLRGKESKGDEDFVRDLQDSGSGKQRHVGFCKSASKGHRLRKTEPG